MKKIVIGAIGAALAIIGSDVILRAIDRKNGIVYGDFEVSLDEDKEKAELDQEQAD